MDAALLLTPIEVDGSTWSQFVASSEAESTCIKAGLLVTFMEGGGSFHGSRQKYEMEAFIEVDEAS